MENLEKLLHTTLKRGEYTIERLPAAGSNRRYFRIFPKNQLPAPSLIGVIGESIPENKAFISIAKTFAKNGIPVPKVIAHSSDCKCYIQEDLGNTSLFDAIANGRKCGEFSIQEKELLKKTIYMLPIIQHIGATGLDFNVCHPIKEFDNTSIFFDLNYFKYCYLKGTGVEFDEVLLESDFHKLAETLLRYNGETFMYRDFQSRNIMLVDSEPYFIDFQGGRKGPLYYDVASFLWQAKANIPDELRDELIEHYLDSLRQFTPIKKGDFIRVLRHFVLFRLLQVLGAYGFRGNFERKEHFLQSIPAAISSLEKLLDEDPFDEYPYLVETLRNMISDYWQKRYTHPDGKTLFVRIFSFSFKKGIPEDVSGNGGGYVFDCRSLPNPGREVKYKKSTGMDQDVIEFFGEHKLEMGLFLENIYTLAETHIQNYIERGFTDLQFSFGCTGGQHRSVFCAEQLALHLQNRFPIKIELVHREQGVKRVI